MAEYLSKAIKRVTIRNWPVWLVLMGMSAAFADELSDPTRPPAALAITQEKTPATLAGEPVLQSVLISPTRMVAIISGQTVKVGDKVGEARVVKITESEVVLRNGQDIQTLKLFPSVEKQRAPRRTGSNADIQ